LGGIALGRHAHPAAAGIDGALLGLDLAPERSMHAVVAQQVRVGLDRPQIVDRDHLDVLAVSLGDGAQDEAPHAPEAVHGRLPSHDSVSCYRRSLAAAMVASAVIPKCL